MTSFTNDADDQTIVTGIKHLNMEWDHGVEWFQYITFLSEFS